MGSNCLNQAIFKKSSYLKKPLHWVIQKLLPEYTQVNYQP